MQKNLVCKENWKRIGIRGVKMNILFLTKLSGYLWAGPNNSVPAQILAQSKYDKVFWFNYNHVKRTEWTKDGLNCINLDDLPSGKLKDLPFPFNNPDLVVFEEFYNFPFCRIISEIKKNKIPYIIVPRSQLTRKAQISKYVKKKIGNILFFNQFAKKARAIHYLTLEEKKDSGDKWNDSYCVIPNGIDEPINKKDLFSTNELRASYIGRIEMYQKGLDLLIEAISEMKNELKKRNFSLSIYGPDRNGSLKILKEMVKKNQIDSLVFFHEAVFGEDKKRVLLNTDIFIMTSRFEGLSMGMIEALSYGIPCLATSGTNMTNEIKQKNAGWVAQNDKNSIKNALQEIVKSNDFVEKGANAQELSKKYSWDSIAKKTHEEYIKFLRVK